MFGSILLALLPIIIVCVLLFALKKSVNFSGVAGWVVCVVIAVAFFNTSVGDAALISGTGVLNSLGIGIMIVASLLQITLMQKSGALNRVSLFLKTLSPQDRSVQIIMICVAAGTALVSIGATPVSILPPIMVALGFSPVIAVALSVIGYNAMCSYGLLGIPVNLFANLTGISLPAAAQLLSIYTPIATLVICLGSLAIAGKWSLLKKGIMPSLLTAIVTGLVAISIAYIEPLQSLISLTGVFAGVAGVLVLILYLKLSRKKIIDNSVLSESETEQAAGYGLFRAFSPWIILVTLLLLTSMIKPINNFLSVDLAMPVTLYAGQTVKLKVFAQAYFWVFVSTMLAIPILKPQKGIVSASFKTWASRSIKPFISNTIFFCIAYVMMLSGGSRFLAEPLNMVGALAAGSAILFGILYPVVAPLLGLFAGFLTGSNASGLAMLASYHMSTSATLGISGSIINAASGSASGLASSFALVKIQNATATIDKMGIENEVVKVVLPTSIIATVIVCIICTLQTLLF